MEINDEWQVMVFITNNFDWSPQSVCDLYRRRWDIEVFFKQIKQSLKLGSFLGHSANAVRWQVYTALMVYVLLRYMAHLSQWGHSFTRLFAVVRSTCSTFRAPPAALFNRRLHMLGIWSPFYW